MSGRLVRHGRALLVLSLNLLSVFSKAAGVGKVRGQPTPSSEGAAHKTCIANRKIIDEQSCRGISAPTPKKEHSREGENEGSAT
jgi:hypothetical protein